MSFKKKLKNIVFRNYFKNPDIVFLFLMLCVSSMILIFFNDFKKVTQGGKNYFDYQYEPPEYIEKGILDYSKNGYYPGHHTFMKMIFRFTYQSNLFVLIVYLLFFTKVRYKNWYPYLVFSCLISILMTGFIYHIVIDKLQAFTQIKFELPYIISHLQHTLIPLTYLYFYFCVNTFDISYRKIWIGWFHPLFYFLFFSLFSYLSMKSYYDDFRPGALIVTKKDHVLKGSCNRDPFKIFPYPFFSPFRPDDKEKCKELGKKQHRFIFKGYKIVFPIILLLFVFVVVITFLILWIKKILAKKQKKKP